MKVLYKAFDGKIFTNPGECEDYEFVKLHPSLFNIIFYNNDNKKYNIKQNDLLNDSVYYEAEKVEIHNNEELSDFLLYSKDNGWCEFEEQITSKGTWERSEDEVGNGVWMKKGDM